MQDVSDLFYLDSDHVAKKLQVRFESHSKNTILTGPAMLWISIVTQPRTDERTDKVILGDRLKISEIIAMQLINNYHQYRLTPIDQDVS